MRTFIAVPIPAESKSIFEDVQSGLRKSDAEVSWPAASSVHLTVKFLGEADPETIPEMATALRSATQAMHGFSLSLKGVGGFPNLRNPRVIWCGVEGQLERLSSLQEVVERVCSQFGFPPEDRPFNPHLTLGRVKGKRNLQRLLDCIKIAPSFESRFAVDHFNIYRSVLSPKGAVYSVLEKIELSHV